MWHDDGDRRQHGNERHDSAAKRGRQATQQRGTTTATGGHNNGKGQYGNMRHDDGDRRQHGDGKGQQGDRRYNNGDGRHDEAARRRQRVANYYE